LEDVAKTWLPLQGGVSVREGMEGKKEKKHWGFIRGKWGFFLNQLKTIGSGLSTLSSLHRVGSFFLVFKRVFCFFYRALHRLCLFSRRVGSLLRTLHGKEMESRLLWSARSFRFIPGWRLYFFFLFLRRTVSVVYKFGFFLNLRALERTGGRLGPGGVLLLSF